MTVYNESSNCHLRLDDTVNTLNLSGNGVVDIIVGFSDPMGTTHGTAHINSTAD